MTLSMKPIPGFNGAYSATEDGRIYSHRTDKFLKPKKHKNGYSVVCISDPYGNVHDLLIHRLVCLTYHGYPEIWQTDVNHIDCNKGNNRPENLEWCSRKENMQAAVRAGISIGKYKRLAKPGNVKKPVIGFDADGVLVERFESISAAMRAGYNNVSVAVNSDGKRTCGGLTWRYA